MRRRTAFVAVLALVLTVVGGVPAYADEVEQIKNGAFDGTADPWWSTAGSPIALDAGRACIDVPAGTTDKWDVAIGQSDVPLVAGQNYRLSFTASGTPAEHAVRAIAGLINLVRTAGVAPRNR